MNRYDDQWADVHAAEALADHRARIDAWERAHRAAGYFTAARDARVAVGGAA